MSRKGTLVGNGPWGFRAEDRVVLFECHFQVFSNVDIAVVTGINKVFLISHSFPRQNGSRLERGRRTSFGHQTREQALMETEEGSDS